MKMSPVVTLGVALLVAGTNVRSQERDTTPVRLADALSLTGSGVRVWLKELGVADGGATVERVLAVSLEGQILLARTGEHSSVRFDAEMDALLRTPGQRIVLIHNHPANVGLSGADLKQLTKPTVAAIVAIGHDASVFIASAGATLDREFFLDTQYAPARDAVRMGLRAEWPSGSVSVAAGDGHFSHLVTLALARARVVQYWFRLQGIGQESFNTARLPFARVVEHAALDVRR